MARSKMNYGSLQTDKQTDRQREIFSHIDRDRQLDKVT